jgi:periplasmic protein TonB
MFAESLLESSGRGRTNQRWTTLFSLALEGLLVGVLVLIPLLQNQGMPRLRWISSVSTPLPPAPRGVSDPGHGGGGSADPRPPNPILMQPIRIPTGIDRNPDTSGPPAGANGPNLPFGRDDGIDHGTGPIFNLPVVPPRPVMPPTRRVSIVTEGDVIHRVLPLYPPIARRIGAEGPVVLQAVISREGTVESLRVVRSAHPTLNEAALEAVAQWRFRPYLLNGVAVEVEAQVTVNFMLSH